MTRDTTYGPEIVPLTKNTTSDGLNQSIGINIVVNTSTNNGVFQIVSSSTAFNSRTVYAVIEYTKVTD